MQLELVTGARLLQITPQERQALQLLANGDTSVELARRLGISTVESDALLTRLFATMGVTTRADAVGGARRRGLLAARSI